MTCCHKQIDLQGKPFEAMLALNPSWDAVEKYFSLLMLISQESKVENMGMIITRYRLCAEPL